MHARAQRDYRRRQKDGRVVLNIEVSEVELTEPLILCPKAASCLRDHTATNR